MWRYCILPLLFSIRFEWLGDLKETHSDDDIYFPQCFQDNCGCSGEVLSLTTVAPVKINVIMYLFHFRCKKMFVTALAIFILYQYEQKELLISIPFLLGCLTLFLTVLAICITYLLARSKATASIYFFRFYVFYKLTKLFISFF